MEKSSKDFGLTCSKSYNVILYPLVKWYVLVATNQTGVVHASKTVVDKQHVKK